MVEHKTHVTKTVAVLDKSSKRIQFDNMYSEDLK